MYSSSAYWGEYYKKDSFFYFKRQILFTALGIIAMGFLARYYHIIAKKIKPIYILIAVWALLIWAFFSEPIANVHRWIKLGPFRMQPSEFAKIAVIIFLADYLDRRKSRIIKSAMGIVPLIIPVIITALLIAFSPDLGTPLLILFTTFVVLFAAGVKFSHLATWMSLSGAFAVYEIFRYEYRWKRLLAFLSFEPDVSNEGYHLYRSFTAIGSGGLFGVGLGASKMKLMYLPAGHTDFIFSVIAEEIGFTGVLIVIALFCTLLVRGLMASAKSLDLHDRILALGITVMIVTQSFVNMAVSLGIIPTKGLPLPFFSYGGSSIISTLIMMGILLNITSRQDKLRGLR